MPLCLPLALRPLLSLPWGTPWSSREQRPLGLIWPCHHQKAAFCLSSLQNGCWTPQFPSEVLVQSVASPCTSLSVPSQWGLEWSLSWGLFALGGAGWILLPHLCLTSLGHLTWAGSSLRKLGWCSSRLHPKPPSRFWPSLGHHSPYPGPPLQGPSSRPFALLTPALDGALRSPDASAPVRPPEPRLIYLLRHSSGPRCAEIAKVGVCTWGWARSARANSISQVSIQGSPPKADAAGASLLLPSKRTRKVSRCQALQAELPGAPREQHTAGQEPRGQLKQNACLFPRRRE